MFCINVDIDETLLFEKNKGIWLMPTELFFLVILEKLLWHELIQCLFGEISTSESIY